jgi:hypothetical protein
MEDHYDRLLSARSDVEISNDLIRRSDSISSETCVRCQIRGGSKKPWQIYLMLILGLIVSTILGIWLWCNIWSPRSVVPESRL